MIQRIQSIYLLIASLLSGALPLIISLWTQTKENTPIYVFDMFSSNSILENLIPVCFLISALVSLITIFLYNNRKLQFVVGRIAILINLFLLGLLIYLSLTLSGETAVSEKGIGMIIPILVILLIVLANKAIKKDEDLVKSVDRLR
ncbi:protein of unknown function [Tenacibaculum sp. MAR_2009_124]|uniref:DUF4293 family protein n=1 Tax=Tenacibaculum sp. MAR_2009_124 TaxID=1250059 RepID=UPI00089B5395|nr:DUF4293 family protein [Tenacibaculum sp. MAR_2009_124]SEB71810.1 protein of unknown function [Tenacibaculum sp. MAR_2009_124]